MTKEEGLLAGVLLTTAVIAYELWLIHKDLTTG